MAKILNTMLFSRQKYIDRLIAHKHNHQIKVVTGIRRCGKSYLLFNLFLFYEKILMVN